MRTTIDLDEDVAAAVAHIRRERRVGVSQAVNELARAGLTAKRGRRRFRQRTARLTIRVDVTNVADTLDILEGPSHR
jgi:hypothetical protein